MLTDQTTINWFAACGVEDVPANGGVCVKYQETQIALFIEIWNGVEQFVFAIETMLKISLQQFVSSPEIILHQMQTIIDAVEVFLLPPGIEIAVS